MWLKCEIMRRALATHRYVVFTDGDIVYERPGAVAYCVEMLLRKNRRGGAAGDGEEDRLSGEAEDEDGEDSGLELVMQNDGMTDNGSDGWGLCAGFMAARSTAATRACFAVDEENTLQPGWDDQRYLNTVLGRMRHASLPLKLFPNGQYWGANREKLGATRPGPYLIHFNWIVGGEKQTKMQADGKWYVAQQQAQWVVEDARPHVADAEDAQCELTEVR